MDEAGEGKKVLLYHNNVGNIVVYGQKYFDKMIRSFEIFSQNRDKMSIFWQVSAETRNVLEIHYPELYEKYGQMYEKYIEMDLGIYSEEDDYSKAVAVADAYYGDRDTIMNKVRLMGKPVMIQNIEV